VGITKFACEQLTDITYIELPAIGKKVEKGKSFGVIESVKSANDLYAPVSGEVVAVNKAVVDAPDQIGVDPFGAGWMVKLKVAAPDTAGLLSLADYQKQTASH
jgi:glycine cleavage system H protein